MWDSAEVLAENPDRLGIEVDGGESPEAGAFEAEGEAAAAAEEIEEGGRGVHGRLMES